MSIQTTYSVTREFAIAAIEKKLEECTDRQLENILEETIHNGFYNFSIVEADELEREKRTDEAYGMTPRVLDDLDDLPEYNDAY